MADDRRGAIEQALSNFSSWLDEVSPRHRQEREPVCLEEDAPNLIRELWNHIGWSRVVGPRPERAFTDSAVESKILSWFSKSETRERWNVRTREEALQAVRAKLPEKSRYIATRPGYTTIAFTDETSGCDDPPVWTMNSDGETKLSWPSYVQRFVWLTCKDLGVSKSYNGPPVSGKQPFVPVLPGFWAIHDGIWALGDRPVNDKGNEVKIKQPSMILFRSSIEYFDYVMGLPDDKVEHFFGHPESDIYLAVDDPKDFDPENPKIPGYRTISRTRGMVKLDGIRFWVSKFDPGKGCATIHVPPGRGKAAKAILEQRDIEVYEHDYLSEDEPETPEVAR